MIGPARSGVDSGVRAVATIRTSCRFWDPRQTLLSCEVPVLDVLAIIGRVLFGAAISGLIHFYVWRRLVKPAHLPRRWHIGITVTMILLMVSIPVTTWTRNVWP